MNKAEFEEFKQERAAVNRTANNLRKSVLKKALQFVKETKSIDLSQDRFSFRSHVIDENSIYGAGAIKLEVCAETGEIVQTYKIPRNYVFPTA